MVRRSFLVVLLLLFSVAAYASARREVRAARTDHPPVIDGHIQEVEWSSAPVIKDFQQQRPDNGKPSSEASEVWLLFDDDALYVGARLSDRAPATRLLGRRDTFLDSDWFGILLDPQFDRRSGNAFFVNPDGVQYDEVISNDSEEDTNWDAVWQSATSLGENGWEAEMRIPFSQLRFEQKEQQVWGINFIRWIRRRQEQARLISNPRNVPGFASRFGDLTGLDGVRPRPKIELTPYVVSAMNHSQTVRAGDPLNDRSSGNADGGLDLRWTSRSNLTVGATINPDFGQVEVDPAILNLSQFELFFPEKRPFFLDGSKVFTFGGLATVYYSPYRLTHPLLFYSRRIGRVPQGNGRIVSDYLDVPDETTIRGAAKIIGRLGQFNVGVLDAITGSETARFANALESGQRTVEPSANYFVARTTRDFGDRARLGILLTSVNRGDQADTRFLPMRSLVTGVDGYTWLGDRDVLVDWFLASSHVSGDRQAMTLLQRAPAHQYQRPDAEHLGVDSEADRIDGWGGKVALSREKGTWRFQLQTESYSPGFEINDLGFLSRSDIRAAHAMLTWFDVANRKHTRSNRISVGRYLSWTHGGERIGDGIAADSSTTFMNYWTLGVQAARSMRAFDDRETRGGPLVRRPSGWSGQVRLATDTRKKYWGEVAQTGGEDDEGGSIQSTKLSLTVRPKSNLTLSLITTSTTSVIASKWIATAPDPTATNTFGSRYIFGRLTEKRLDVAPRVDWTLRTNLTLQLYLQPFAASGSYRDLKSLARPGGDYDPYVPSANFQDPDFIFRTLRGNAVLRWELRGASTLFVVWNQQRSDRRLADSEGRLDDFRSISGVNPDDRFMIKISHRFDFPK